MSRLNKINVTYERDSQFAQNILTLLRHRGEDLSTKTYNALLLLGTNPHQLGYPTAQMAVKELLNVHPALTQYALLEHMQSACFLPVFIWANEMQEIVAPKLRPHLMDWRATFDQSHGGLVENSLRALNITYALRDEFAPNAQRELASFWQDENRDALWSNAYTYEDKRFAAWNESVIRLGLFHEHLASLGIKENFRPGEPTWHLRWAQEIGEALDQMTHEQEADCIKHWINSDLSNVYALRASKFAHVGAWLLPGVQALLDPLLPASDVVRWQMLPWAAIRGPNQGRSNQAIANMYCPKMARVIDVMAPPEAWRERKTIAAYVTKFSKNAPQPEAMPDAGDLFDMA